MGVMQIYYIFGTCNIKFELAIFRGFQLFRHPMILSTKVVTG